jgi:hypothetical protein
MRIRRTVDATQRICLSSEADLTVRFGGMSVEWHVKMVDGIDPDREMKMQRTKRAGVQ